MNNKIIDVQEILFKEMKRMDSDSFEYYDKSAKQTEFQKATALYNMSTNFIKTLNANLAIMNLAKKNEGKYEDLMSKLGLTNEE